MPSCSVSLDSTNSNSLSIALLQPALTPPEKVDQGRSLQLTTVCEDGRRILCLLRHVFKGHSSSSPWCRFTLRPQEYLQLLTEITSNEPPHRFWVHKRHNYFPSRSLFILRMLTPLHKQFTQSVISEIILHLKQLTTILSSPTATEFVKKIASCGSITARFDDYEYGNYEPDGSFQHDDATFPGILLEVLLLTKTNRSAAVGRRLYSGLEWKYKSRSRTGLGVQEGQKSRPWVKNTHYNFSMEAKVQRSRTP
jgi:hypothetical protein